MMMIPSFAGCSVLAAARMKRILPAMSPPPTMMVAALLLVLLLLSVVELMLHTPLFFSYKRRCVEIRVPISPP